MMSGLPSHCWDRWPRPSALSVVSSDPPGWKKYRKIMAMATPLIRYGKKMIPLNRLLNRTLKLRTVARYSASRICTTDAPM
jgi:hypothetical protein